MLRHIFALAIFLLPTFCMAAPISSTELIQHCSPLANQTGAKIPVERTTQAFYCAGFIEALTFSLKKIHQYYQASFPNLTYPIRDQATANRYIATSVLLGPDVCFPQQLTPQIVARIIVKYGRDNPAKLTELPWDFASSALLNAYPCNKTR